MTAVCSTHEGKVVYAQAYIALVLNVGELFCCKNALRDERDGDATSRRRRRQPGSVGLRSRRQHAVGACVRDDTGFALWVRAGSDVVANFGKWRFPWPKGKVTRAWVFFPIAFGPQHRDPGRFLAQDPETHERVVSRQIPVRPTSSVRSSARSVVHATRATSATQEECSSGPKRNKNLSLVPTTQQRARSLHVLKLIEHSANFATLQRRN